MTYRDPLAALETDFPLVKIWVRRLPDTYAQTIWEGAQPRIEIAADLGPIVQRVALAHEMQHLVAGEPCTSLCGNNERAVVDATAKWLLPDIQEIGQALAAQPLAAAAIRLEVTSEVLMQRLAAMTDEEHEQLGGLLPGGSDPPGLLRAAHGPRRVQPRTRPCHASGRTPRPSLAGPE